MRGLILLAGALLAGCVPNPRSQIPAIVAAALEQTARSPPADRACVERTIAPWRPAEGGGATRRDPPAPAGFADLYDARAFCGGGGIAGDRVAGVMVQGGTNCFVLRGPVVAGDRAMIEMRLGLMVRRVWMLRTDAGWRAVTTTDGAS